MSRERSTSIVDVTARLWVCVAVMAACSALRADVPTVIDVQTARIETRQISRTVDIVGTPAECTSDDQCDDGNACTEDVCSNGACLHTPDPDCVPCEPGFLCPPIDVVFIMDTSGSMKDEAAALCAGIGVIISELEAVGAVVNPRLLGITETPGGLFYCLNNSVVRQLGGTVPGDPESCPFPDTFSAFESWGPATAIVAERYGWTADATRLIVPISDEGPCNGDEPEGCNDPGDDRDSIENAMAVARAHGVVVSPVCGTGSDACVITLAESLAAGTGGMAFQTQDPGTDLIAGILELLLSHCEPDPRCEDGRFCTQDDSCVDGVCLGGAPRDCRDLDDQCTVGVCDEDAGACEPQPVHEGEPCDNGDPCTIGDVCGEGVCVGGDPPDCDDGNVCTDDGCDPATGCVYVNNTGPCDDEAFCTVGDACIGGTCAGVPRDCSALDDLCLVGVCNEETGDCVQRPSEAGTPCDDGDECTIHDACDGEGVCRGTPACVELCLEVDRDQGPAGVCFGAGEVVVTHVVVTPSADEGPILTGGQFLIGYDPTMLEFLSAEPVPPFVELIETIDVVRGRVFYAVGIVPGNDGIRAPANMATLRFRTITECATVAPLCFFSENPVNTRLVDDTGHPVPHHLCCTDELVIGGPPTALTCPGSVSVNADAGAVTALVTWDAIHGQGGCGAEVGLNCTASSASGSNIDHLIETGGQFPVGLSTFACIVTDDCGASASCEWSVNVNGVNTIDMSVQLSPIMVEGPLHRCIEFAFYANCVEEPVYVDSTMEFGSLFDLPGQVTNVEFKVPAGQYVCVAARDPLHTLRSVAWPEIVDRRFVAEFRGDPFFGGNWLVGGNLNGDHNIDMLDFGIYVSQVAQVLDPETPCGTEGPHADINGDGVVNSLDFAFIERNMLAADKGTCCPGGAASVASPVTEISVRELEAMGLGSLGRADLNGDGVLNRDDVNAVLKGKRLTDTPFSGPIRSER